MENSKSSRVIAVTSGKGGVGKSSLTINIAISMARLGKSVCIVDADLGMANIDVLLNMDPEYNITHVMNGEKEISDIIIKGPLGIYVLAGGSGWYDIANLHYARFEMLLKAFDQIEEFVDVFLLDTGAGINDNVVNFLLASDEVLLITTPEPHAITDAYAVIKTIANKDSDLSIKLLMNKVENTEEGKLIGGNIAKAASRFLGISIKYAGHVQDDVTFCEMIKEQKLPLLELPRAKTSQQIGEISREILGYKDHHIKGAGIKGFLKRLSGFLSKISYSLLFSQGFVKFIFL